MKESPDFLKGASVADKVIGKAPAALVILGGIKKVYTDVIGSTALVFFTKYRNRCIVYNPYHTSKIEIIQECVHSN